MSRIDPRLWALLFFSVLCLMAARADAQTGPSTDSCSESPAGSGDWYKYGASGLDFATAGQFIYANSAEVCSTFEAEFCAQSPTPFNCGAGRRPFSPAGSTASGTARCRDAMGTNLHSPGQLGRELQTDPATQCPADAPEACDAENFDGDFEGTVRDSPTLQAVPVGGSVCVDNDGPFQGCRMQKVAGATTSGGYAAQWRIFPEPCTTEAPSTEADEPTAEACTPVGDGEYCASPSGEGDCGYLNDKFICLDSVPENGCKYMSDGSGVCQSDADAPPKPDSGTPGEPATPDDTIQAESADPPAPGGGGCGAGCDYFDPDTVAGSGRDPTDTGGGTGGGTNVGGVGSPDPDDDEEGEFTSPELQEVGCDYEGCTEEYYTRISAAPIVAAIASVGSSIPTGSCPSYTLEAFGEEYSLSAPMCDIWDSLSSILSALFLVVWAWVATRIVLSA